MSIYHVNSLHVLLCVVHYLIATYFQETYQFHIHLICLFISVFSAYDDPVYPLCNPVIIFNCASMRLRVTLG